MFLVKLDQSLSLPGTLKDKMPKELLSDTDITL